MRSEGVKNLEDEGRAPCPRWGPCPRPKSPTSTRRIAPESPEPEPPSRLENHPGDSGYRDNTLAKRSSSGNGLVSQVLYAMIINHHQTFLQASRLRPHAIPRGRCQASHA